MSLVTSTGSFAGNSSTDAAGNYAITGVVPGDYCLKTSNSRGDVDQVYNASSAPTAR